MALNLLEATTVEQKNGQKTLDGTGDFELFENASGSEKVLEGIFLRATNIDGTSNQTITLKIVDNSVSPGDEVSGGSTITVPADAAIDLLKGDYDLSEGYSVVVQAGGANDIDVIWSYREWS